MKLIAHVGSSGRIRSVVAIPDGETTGMLIAGPGIEVREIEDHGLEGDVVDTDALAEILGKKLDFTTARGKLSKTKD